MLRVGSALGLIIDFLSESKATTTGLLVFLALAVSAAVFFFKRSAPPSTITITTGPEGSTFHTNAVRYSNLLAKAGIKLEILTSRGSLENLQRLSNPREHADVGFVLGGVTNGASERLFSLGSVAYQPLLVFHRGAPIEILSALAGKRVAVGPVGSGTRALALTLLELSGIKTNDSTTLLDLEPQPAAKSLLEGKADAVFLMGEDAPIALLRELLRAPDVHLLSFRQAVAYTRRISYLNVLEIPTGAIDFARNIPPSDVRLVGPTVELIGRQTLHPALSDVLLEAAKEVHGKVSILQRKGEFPAPIEHDFRISPDAARFYKSGKMLIYRYLPFWLAALTSRVLYAFVPVVLVLIPIMRSAPRIYSWRVRSRIYRWYRALLVLEREWVADLKPEKRQELLQRLDEIERAVNKLKVPAFAADLYYDLRGHIVFVRRLLEHQMTN